MGETSDSLEYLMPLLDHFHPPLHGPRRWEGFHHAWAAFIAQQLNQETLPPDYFAESEISLGPELVIGAAPDAAVDWPPAPKITAKVDFARLDSCEIRIYQNVGGAELRGAIELASPGNKDRAGSRLAFAAKCAGYLKQGIGLVIVDVVTARTANLHAEIFRTLELKDPGSAWESDTGLYAAAYRAVTLRKNPRLEVWSEALALGKTLPVMPLWLSLDLCVPLRLEDSYLAACRSLRIPA
jgi:hypothetical protein